MAMAAAANATAAGTTRTEDSSSEGGSVDRERIAPLGPSAEGYGYLVSPEYGTHLLVPHGPSAGLNLTMPLTLNSPGSPCNKIFTRSPTLKARFLALLQH
jgi:hypothetical protein